MASDLTEKYVVFTHDHARSCQGREYICSCGHDDKITKAADELVNIIQAQDRRIAELEAALTKAADQLALVHDDAFKQAAGYGLVTSDGRDFSCFQLNLCETAARAIRALIPEQKEG